MQIAVIQRGKACSLYGVIEKERCLISDFIMGLSEERFKQVFVLFREIWTSGEPRSPEKFHRLKNAGDIHELKTRKGVRFLCFRGGAKLPNSLILTEGLDKTTDKRLNRYIEGAMSLHEEYLKFKDIKKIIVEMEVGP